MQTSAKELDERKQRILHGSHHDDKGEQNEDKKNAKFLRDMKQDLYMESGMKL